MHSHSLFRSLCTHTEYVHAGSLQKLDCFDWHFRLGLVFACACSPMYSVQRPAKRSRKSIYFSADSCWQRWRPWYSAVTLSIAKGLGVAYSCSLVLFILWKTTKDEQIQTETTAVRISQSLKMSTLKTSPSEGLQFPSLKINRSYVKKMILSLSSCFLRLFLQQRTDRGALEFTNTRERLLPLPLTCRLKTTASMWKLIRSGAMVGLVRLPFLNQQTLAVVS